jgi:hypothetical protein
MPLPDVDFVNIRTHDGSRHSGFEELCTQLASLEERPAGSVFTRKGRGGDAGLECFTKLPGGDELGWQAKYVFEWDSSLSAQLDKSARTAMVKHPKLTKLVVCLPFDLPDSRPDRGKSTHQKWSDWKSKWEKTAKDQGRPLSIQLWGKHELSQRLAIDNPLYSGRLLYWFGREALTTAWFSEQFAKSKASLGSRYTPESNIELPIRQDFLTFARDPSIETIVHKWGLDVAERGAATIQAALKLNGGIASSQTDALDAALTKLNRAFAIDTIGPETPYPIGEWREAASEGYAAARETLSWIYTLPPGEERHGTTPQYWARENLFRFSDKLSEIIDALASDGWRLVNAHAVLLVGAAGTGKSHLLADVVEHQVHADRPAIFTRSYFTQRELPTGDQLTAMLGEEPTPELLARYAKSPEAVRAEQVAREKQQADWNASDLGELYRKFIENAEDTTED